MLVRSPPMLLSFIRCHDGRRSCWQSAHLRTLLISFIAEVLQFLTFGWYVADIGRKYVARTGTTHPFSDVFFDFTWKYLLVQQVVAMIVLMSLEVVGWRRKYAIGNTLVKGHASLTSFVSVTAAIDFAVYLGASVRLFDPEGLSFLMSGPKIWSENLDIGGRIILTLLGIAIGLSCAIHYFTGFLVSKITTGPRKSLILTWVMVQTVVLVSNPIVELLTITPSADLSAWSVLPPKAQNDTKEANIRTFIDPTLLLWPNNYTIPFSNEMVPQIQRRHLLSKRTPLVQRTTNDGKHLANLCLGKYRYEESLVKTLSNDAQKKLWVDTRPRYSSSLGKEPGIPDTKSGSSIVYPKLRDQKDILIIVTDSVRQEAARNFEFMPFFTQMQEKYKDRVFSPRRMYSQIGSAGGFFQLLFSLNDYNRRHFHTLNETEITRRSYMLETLKQNGYDLRFFAGANWKQWRRCKWQASKRLWDEFLETTDGAAVRAATKLLSRNDRKKPQFVVIWLQGTHGPYFNVEKQDKYFKLGNAVNKQRNILRQFDRLLFNETLLGHPVIRQSIDEGKITFALTSDHGKIFPDEVSSEGNIGYGGTCIIRDACTRIPAVIFFSSPITNAHQLDSHLPFTLQQDILPSMIYSLGPDHWFPTHSYSDGVTLLENRNDPSYDRLSLRTGALYGGGMGTAHSEPGGSQNDMPILVLLTPQAKIVVHPQAINMTSIGSMIGFWIAEVVEHDTQRDLLSSADIAFETIEEVANTAFHQWLRTFGYHNIFHIQDLSFGTNIITN